MNRFKRPRCLSYLIACGLFCVACTPQDPAGDTDTTATGGGESSTTTAATDTTDTTAATAATAATDTTDTTDTTTATTTTTTGGACDGSIPNPDQCQQCTMDVCCSELSACLDEAECTACLLDPNADPNVCSANAAMTTLRTCSLPACPTCGNQTTGDAFCDAPDATPSAGSCGAPSDTSGVCNPITNEGCAAGESCDISPNGFVCYDSGNTHAICEDCGAAGDNVFCVEGLTCIGKCAKFCCDDGDCGDGTCQKGAFMANPEVGYCVTPA